MNRVLQIFRCLNRHHPPSESPMLPWVLLMTSFPNNRPHRLNQTCLLNAVRLHRNVVLGFDAG